jgi:hypothetical protein
LANDAGLGARRRVDMHLFDDKEVTIQPRSGTVHHHGSIAISTAFKKQPEA